MSSSFSRKQHDDLDCDLPLIAEDMERARTVSASQAFSACDGMPVQGFRCRPAHTAQTDVMPQQALTGWSEPASGVKERILTLRLRPLAFPSLRSTPTGESLGPPVL